jgi:hypothetical protein
VGTRTDNLIYQLRTDGKGKWLFIAHGRKPYSEDVPRAEHLTIKVDGLYHPVCYNTMTGQKEEVSYHHEKNQTIINTVMFAHDSLLLRLEDVETAEEPAGIQNSDATCAEKIAIEFPEEAKVQTEEPNVLLLDMAESRLNDSPWMAKEEILRIDNHYRRLLGYPLRMEAWAQPWVTKDETALDKKNYTNTLSLRFRFESKVAGKAVRLALEHANDCTVCFNDMKVSSEVVGTYVDMDIDLIELGMLAEGENVIEVTMPYYAGQNVEAMYLLGDFGVKVYGTEAVVEDSLKYIHFGDISKQGYAFYSGNISYEASVEVPEDGELMISTTYFRCPVIGVDLDGERVGDIAFSPYEISLGNVKKGTHTIKLTAYGNRMNTFGTLHLCDEHDGWAGPNAWRSEGSRWSYEYQLQRTGILKRPEIWLKK